MNPEFWLQRWHEGHLGSIAVWHVETTSDTRCVEYGGQHTMHRPQFVGQCEFSDELATSQRFARYPAVVTPRLPRPYILSQKGFDPRALMRKVPCKA